VWRDALDTIGLACADMDADELRGLFDRSWVSHQAWDAAGRP